ncbi:YeeE/YedE thiosulfate transporter family protein [Ideonella sp. YS5]|uniref:YeeE/YedE thiosulfate transporter family protein n=1 Tax=Ideonella sp. YS5 TaxID=3453714 RepID=UPI003EEA9189
MSPGQWLLALAAGACAALMGAAIQRGATCTVAAVHELMDQGRGTRLRSLLEASLWVAGGLLLLRALPLPAPTLPAPYAVSRWTLLGSALLGLGAFVNRACVFGAVARLGNGEWAYLATPPGFFFGCLSVDALFRVRPDPLPGGSALFAAPLALGWAWAAFVLWRVSGPWRRRGGHPRLAWTPHAATLSIGLAFLALLLLEGSWAYTDALAELARGMAMGHGTRLGLFGCLLAGAMWGGWRAGLWKARTPRAVELLRCFSGGLLMGWGSLLIPGGNDGLILLGLPMLWPYAWVAFATMCLVIAAALWAARQVRPASIA